MEDEKIIWFDLRDYGYVHPVPVHQSASELAFEEANKQINTDGVLARDDHMERLKNILTVTGKYCNDNKSITMEWAILCITHMAILSLQGKKEPTILFNDK